MSARAVSAARAVHDVRMSAGADATLTNFGGQIRFTTSTGMRSEAGYSTRSGQSPREVLCDMTDELARLAALAGWHAEFEAAMRDAFSRVAAWQSENGSKS